MNSLLEFLDGKKTYIGIAIGAVYSILIALGLVESEEMVWSLIVAWTGVSFRLAQSKK